MMNFDFIEYIWNSYSDEELTAIINGRGLETDKKRAKQILESRNELNDEILGI